MERYDRSRLILFIVFTCFFFSTNTNYAQHDGQLLVFSCTGNVVENESSMSYTIGEAVTFFATDNRSIDISAGFQQASAEELTHSVNEFSYQNVVVFPNPTSDFICIDESPSIGTEYYIFDLQGKLIREVHPRDGKIDTQALGEGLYSLLIMNDNTTTTKKFIVIK